MDKRILEQCRGFQWDDGNREKNQQKHDVTWQECEQIFFNEPLLLLVDDKHSRYESRYFALGRTHQNRKLFVVFTIRNKFIRVISARPMHKKERKIYDNAG